MAAGDIRPYKVTKKTKSSGTGAVIELVEVETTSMEDGLSPDARLQTRKSQGIVIDGRTYTCATCKTGHRVGICKHAKERPMKPTHPPGRPPAGAPKKVVCDCPKNCNCTKKDCKCARTCHCTQPMYMLVYVPAPEEDVDAEEERGQWKLGEQVVTDLRGNILTPEQVKERNERKQAIKSTPFMDKTRSTSTTTRTTSLTNAAGVENTEQPVESCCKHKQSVATRNNAAQALHQPGIAANNVADGCNCGHTCTCAFCPQHPNNATSMNVARQQAMYFANHSFMNSQPIVPFLPAIPQGSSCMGGQPRFAISRNAQRPSFDELQRTFPNPGYVIGYPIWSTRTDSAGFPIAPFPIPSPPYMNIGTPLIDIDTKITPSIFHTPQMMPTEQAMPFDFSQDEFGIGDAFVASAGAEGWGINHLSAGLWSPDTTAISTPFQSAMTEGTYVHSSGNQPVSSQFNHATLHTNDFSSDHTARLHPRSLGDQQNFAEPVPLPSPIPSLYSQKSCCQPPTNNELPTMNNTVHMEYFPATVDPPLSADHQPYLDSLG